MVIERRTRRGFDGGKVHPKARRRADQSRTAHMHLADGGRHLRDRRHVFEDELMRKKALIDDLHDTLVVWLQPNGLKMLPADFHGDSDVGTCRRLVKSRAHTRDRARNRTSSDWLIDHDYEHEQEHE